MTEWVSPARKIYVLFFFSSRPSVPLNQGSGIFTISSDSLCGGADPPSCLPLDDSRNANEEAACDFGDWPFS